DSYPAQCSELAAGHRVWNDVRRASEAMDVRVQAAAAPRPLELQTLLAERQLQRRDRGVELGCEPDRTHAQPRERMVRRAQDLFEVVDDLHASRVQGGRAGCAGDDRHVRAVAARCEGGGVARDAAADDTYPGQRSTIRRVSATSRFNCWTRSSGVGNLMSGCR